jgi:AcrR family transcriptional regulator
MSVAVISYRLVMGRWEPNARGRLARAATTLYAEHGYEQTTTAEIAQRAGLTERTFFRHFADKREVVFYGMDSARDLLVQAIADAPATATAMDAVSAALQAAASLVQETPEAARDPARVNTGTKGFAHRPASWCSISRLIPTPPETRVPPVLHKPPRCPAPAAR